MPAQVLATRAATPPPPQKECLEVTLLELVTAVNDVADNEQEVVATVAHMLNSGSVRLRGTFRDSALTP